jgi:hypothetical protein
VLDVSCAFAAQVQELKLPAAAFYAGQNSVNSKVPKIKVKNTPNAANIKFMI